MSEPVILGTPELPKVVSVHQETSEREAMCSYSLPLVTLSKVIYTHESCSQKYGLQKYLSSQSYFKKNFVSRDYFKDDN